MEGTSFNVLTTSRRIALAFLMAVVMLWASSATTLASPPPSTNGPHPVNPFRPGIERLLSITWE